MVGVTLKILVLSFYYPPDLSAGSFRAVAMVTALKSRLGDSCHIDVLTSVPNRYGSFSADASKREDLQGVHIHRIQLPAHRGGMRDQAVAFLTYYRLAMRHVKSQDYDLVVGTSSRLMTAVLAARVAHQKGALLYLDIRDIFVDTIKDVLSPPLALVFKPLFSWLERFAINRADKVNLVSEGFSQYFRARYPLQKFSYFSNGIDSEFQKITQSELSKQKNSQDLLTVLYAGNLGEGQGLHAILPELALRLRERVIFKVIGDGGRRDALCKAIAELGVDNIVMHPPVTRSVLIEEYAKADILFLHLNDYDAFEKVLPSKIFEYAAMGKPIWAGVSGFAAKFIHAEVSNSAVFYPCDVDSALVALNGLDIKDNPRPEFLHKFSRTRIMDSMACDILSLSRKCI